MRMRMMLALLLATVAIGPAAAQRSDNVRGGIPTETQNRLSSDAGYDLIWNLIGLLGLLGLLGFKRQHSEDSYHPSLME
jgi:hypothetical protein